MEKKTSSIPNGSSTPSSASTSSSMVKKTSSPKGSSSSSVSRNPPATTQPHDEILQRFQKLWSNEMGSFSKSPFCNADDVPILTTPKTAMGCLSDRDLGKKQINDVHQVQRFTFMGSSSSSNPNIVEDEFQRYSAFKKNNRPTPTTMDSLALINGGALLNPYSDLVGKYSSSMNYGLDRVPVNSVGKFNGHAAVNHQPSNGYTLEDQPSADYSSTSSSSIDDELNFSIANLRFNLIQLRGWSVERALKICNNDPSLLDEIKLLDIVLMAKLKLGSLYLQKILKDPDPFHFNKIFYATLDFTYPLMFNPEGTYVLRKLYGLCDSSHLKLVVQKILSWPDQLRNAAKNAIGTGTFMKLIRVLISTNPLLLKSILYALDPEFVSMMTSKPGSSLFGVFMKYLDSRQNEILYKTVAPHCIDLATADSGYVSIIALIENTPNPYKKELILKILDNAVYLSQDPKGNYAIQDILDLRIPEIDLMICKNLVGSYLYLSMHKIANNVVEKCIMSSGMEYPISELISSNKLHLLCQDPVGNYVVQKALNVTLVLKRLDLYDSLVGEIIPYLEDLQYHPMGRNVFKQMNIRKVIDE